MQTKKASPVMTLPPDFYGTRTRATELRNRIEAELDRGAEQVMIEWEGVWATQGFIDALEGVLVVKHGPEITHRLVFGGCSDDLKGIIQFVLNARIEQVEDARSHRC